MTPAQTTIARLAQSEGYTLEIDDRAAERPDALGTPQRDELCAQACTGQHVAMRSGIPDGFQFYPVSHEIAEDRCGFTGHHQALWREQISILVRWLRILDRENRDLRHRLEGLEK